MVSDLLPAVVRQKATALGASEWLDALPDLVASIERDWHITIEPPFGRATEAFVAPVTMDDGTHAVLKVIMPIDMAALEHEVTAFRLDNGDGCAQLFRADVERRALLMERLGPSLFELNRPLQERLEFLTATVQRVWRPAADCGLPTGADKGRWLYDFIARTWDEVNRPCSERAIEYALECAQRRIAAHDDARALLVHGDVHQWNTCAAGDRFKLVDPDGLFAEPEYDLGILMREDPVELCHGDPHERSRWLARRTGCNEDAIWEWGVVERVSSGLLWFKVDPEPVGGRQLLAAAEYVAH